MGFLQHSPIGSFRKAIFSFWFRVPSASIAAVVAQKVIDDALAYPPPLSGVLPLITFGKKGSLQPVNIVSGPTIPDAYYVHDFNWDGSDYVEEEDAPEKHQSLFTSRLGTAPPPYIKSPSFIGVDCSDADHPKLCFNFETAVAADRTNVNFIGTSSTSTDRYQYFMTTDGLSPEPPNPPPQVIVANNSDVTSSAPFTGTYVGRCSGANVTPDVWHHAIVAVDITAPCETTGLLITEDEGEPSETRTSASDGVSSAGKVWVSFDDVNLTGENLYDLWPGGPDANALITYDARNVALQANISGREFAIVYQPSDPFWRKFPAVSQTINGKGEPTYSLDAPVAASVGALGIPAPSEFASRVQVVEMAHLQIFTGVSLNTSLEENRRLFVTAEGKPAAKNDAQIALEVPPVIRLTKSSEWKTGKNTGVAGGLARTGTISDYEPGPLIGG